MVCFLPPRLASLAEGGFVRLVRQQGQVVIICRREFLRLTSSIAVLNAAVATARADTYPSRPVRIIIATTAGGSTDIVARMLAQ
jgi:hypothetical protein